VKITSPAQLSRLQTDLAAQDKKLGKKVMICCGPGCLANGATKLVQAFRSELEKKRIRDFRVEALKETGCHGFCEKGPLVVIEPQGTFYTRVTPADVPEIIEQSIRGNQTVERLLYRDQATGEPKTTYHEIDFYRKQTRIALRNLGKIDQYSIDEYIRVGGYQALAKVLTTMTPDQVITEVKASGLRGRGGAGFHTGASGSRAPRRTTGRTTSCATATRATPGRSWTARSWRGIRTACSRG